MNRLGFIGLGRMGGAMAGTLVRAGFRVYGFDVRPERMTAAEQVGVQAVSDLEALVSAVEAVLTSLPSSEVFVRVAQEELLPRMRSGQVLIDLGTTVAAETRRLARAFAERGVDLLDAPVSGGPHGSARGTLHIFVGGDPSAFERCLPIFHALGDPEHLAYCGSSGSGQVVKGVNQLAMGLGTAAYLEAIAFGVRAGVELEPILRGVGGSDGWRAQFAAIVHRLIAGQETTLFVKFPELPYFLTEAQEKGFPLPMTEALYAFLASAPREFRDNMERPIPSFWRELMTRARSE